MKIGIVGLGLIGASLAKASLKADHEVYGTDADNGTVEKALSYGLIQKNYDLEIMSKECDLIVLCVPARSAVGLVEKALQGTAVVTDVSSVKKAICDKVATLESSQSERFIGGHPMAGSEQSGIDSARQDLFASKMWIIVPPEHSSLQNIHLVEKFVSSIGAEHCILSPELHDVLVANISHLPQLASSVLMDIAADKAVDNEILLRLAGGGFRDMTRIAVSNHQMWMDIIEENAEEISIALSKYIDGLKRIRDSIETREFETVSNLFKRSRKARTSLPDAARRLDNLTEILVPIPNIPGVLTNITSLTSQINVYDIKITHDLEQDRGVLSLIVNPEDAENLINDLNNNGFESFSNSLDKSE